MKRNDFLDLKPMLLSEEATPFDNEDYIFEVKFDGTRTLIFVDGDEIIIKSRRNVILNDTYPELLAIKNITKDTCIFDGEIILMDEGKPSFAKLQERSKLKNKYRIKYMQENYPVCFVCFDILFQNKDLTQMTLMERKKILDKFKDTDTFIKSKYIRGKGRDLFEITQKEGLEGVVAKERNSKYFYDMRTKQWIKIKNLMEEEFVICGFITNNNQTISVVLGELVNDEYYYVGKVVMGRKNNLFEKILKEKQKKNYVLNFNKEAIFIAPKYRLKVKFMERTKKGYLRQPFIAYD